MIIFLIGYMGSGKTTLGKKIAVKMKAPFIDLDKVIEEQTGMSIADYFAKHGEAKFRELERDVLQQTCYPQNCIVSTGGGMPCFFDNMDRMNELGISVYLEVPPGVLAHRVAKAKHERPLLSHLDDNELASFIRSKLSERERFYRKATLTVDGAKPKIGEIIEAIAGYSK